MVSVRLTHCPGPEVTAKNVFLIRDTSGAVLRMKVSHEHKFTKEGREKSWGHDFIERVKLVDSTNKALNRGTFGLLKCASSPTRTIVA